MPEGYKVLKEGQASILQRGNDVFYNEAQVSWFPGPQASRWAPQTPSRRHSAKSPSRNPLGPAAWPIMFSWDL